VRIAYLVTRGGGAKKEGEKGEDKKEEGWKKRRKKKSQTIVHRRMRLVVRIANLVSVCGHGCTMITSSHTFAQACIWYEDKTEVPKLPNLHAG